MKAYEIARYPGFIFLTYNVPKINIEIMDVKEENKGDFISN